MAKSTNPTIDFQGKNLHPQKLTWNLEMMVSNRNLLFQGAPIFRFHVCFGGCTIFWFFSWGYNMFHPVTPLFTDVCMYSKYVQIVKISPISSVRQDHSSNFKHISIPFPRFYMYHWNPHQLVPRICDLPEKKEKQLKPHPSSYKRS